MLTVTLQHDFVLMEDVVLDRTQANDVVFVATNDPEHETTSEYCLLP